MAMKQTILETLSILDDRARKESHGFDRERTCDEMWKRFRMWDWEKKGKGLGVQAEKSLSIGVGEYGPSEDPERRQFLLIQAYDEEQKIGGYNGQAAPPVWGIALTTDEVATVQEGIISANTSLVIHKEPRGEPDEGEEDPWFLEASWILAKPEEKKICGVKLSIKVHQYTTPLCFDVLFKMRGGQFQLKEIIETQKKPVIENPSGVSLPKTINTGDHSACTVIARNVPVSTKGNDFFKSEGSSKLEITMEGDGSVSNHGSSGWVQQSVTSPKIKIVNPTETAICVTDFYMEYQEGDVGKKWRKFTNDGKSRDTIIGISARDWSGRISTRNNPTLGTFTVDPHESVEIVLTGRQYMEGVEPYKQYEAKSRLHHNFLGGSGNRSGMIGCRVGFKDDQKSSATLQFEVSNPPLSPGYVTYEDACAAMVKESDSRDGMGADHSCLLFAAADNPVTFQRAYIILTVPKEHPEYWILTLSDDNRNIGRTTRYIYPSALEELAYKARKERETEVEYEKDSMSTLFALVDHKETGSVVYGFKASIRIASGEPEEVLVERSIAAMIDYSVMKQ
eukprot:TRINITY_DN6062_c0_g4_i1.p1 TRINITY_DN6062_c0_g4~~TRINITY_DN6062_c0_g4_i1.p1  ORF type:complete len:572 (+),score=93.58 TRINITY_DN6062_c0_g4_i1:23-1717(+)